MRDAATLETALWYAVYTKPRGEERAESNLRAWGLKTFMPKIRERRSHAYSKAKHSIKHLFPRYIFAQFNHLTDLHKVNYTRGVSGVVAFGENPCPLESLIIESIQSQIGPEGFIKLEEDICAGDRIMIHDGPFKALCGTVEREISESDRLVVLLSSVSYQGRLLIEKALVQKLRQNV